MQISVLPGSRSLTMRFSSLIKSETYTGLLHCASGVLKNKRLIWLVPLLAATALVLADCYVSCAGWKQFYSSSISIPYRPVAVVLGTSRSVRGRLNRFYMSRLEAAAALFRAHKVDGILVTGDNAQHSYNEPAQMKKDLVALGIPARYITIDYAGFRTLDSVVRAKEVFQQHGYTIISQRFHCLRALYIARSAGHDVIAFGAAEVPGFRGAKIRLREILARVKALLDVHVLNTRPRFLGKLEQVNLRQTTRLSNAGRLNTAGKETHHDGDRK